MLGGKHKLTPVLLAVSALVVISFSLQPTSSSAESHQSHTGRAPTGDAPFFVAEPVDPMHGYAYAKINFTAIVKDVDGDTLNLTWEWGDGTPNGTTATGPAGSNTVVTNSHYYNLTPEPGRSDYEVFFTMNLTLDDGNGNSVTALTQVQVIVLVTNQAPTIVNLSAPAKADPSDVVQIVAGVNDSEGEALTWTFVFNDTVSDYHTEVYHTGWAAPGEVVWNNITHVFGSSGTHYVQLNVSDALPPHQVWPHNISDVIAVTITPNQPPMSTSVYGDPASPVIPDGADSVDVNFTLEVFDADGDVVNATWDFGDGSSNVTNATMGGTQVYAFAQVHRFNDPGEFNVSVEITDGRLGHEVTKYLILNITSTNKPPSIIKFSYQTHGPRAFVGEQLLFEVVLTDPELDVIELIWDFGDGSPYDYHNLTDYIDGNVTDYENHTFMVPGNYIMNLRYTDNEIGLFNHSKEFDISILVVVDDVPPVADAGQNKTVLAPTIVYFDGTNSSDNWDISNYTWTVIYNGTPLVLWGPTPYFEFWTPGSYEVVLNVTDMAGNHNTTTVTVEVVEVIPEFDLILPVAAVMMLIPLVYDVKRRRRLR